MVDFGQYRRGKQVGVETMDHRSRESKAGVVDGANEVDRARAELAMVLM